MSEPAITEQDEADLTQLYTEPDGEHPEPDFHPVLEVWQKVLQPAADEAEAKISPQWANKICSSYREIAFAQMPEFQKRYFGKLLELATILDEEIATDDECLNPTTPEEDLEQNGVHYRNLLRDWQLRIMQWELDWDITDPLAGVEIAAVSEVHKLFLGEMGVVAYLENIKYEVTDADRQELIDALNALKEG